MDKVIQIYVSQPSDKHLGMYEVAKKVANDYIPLKGEIYLSRGEAENRAHELNEEYKSELAQSMRIVLDCWVRLKSDHSKEYSVRGISANSLDCLSFGAKREVLDINDVELITDNKRIEYLENHKNKLFTS